MRPRAGTRSAGRDDVASSQVDGGGRSAHVLSRREVLRGLAASGLTAGLVGSVAMACTDDAGPNATDGESGTTEAEEAIARIGRRYREERPDEDDRDVLLERLGTTDAAAATGPSLLATLDAQVAEDHEADRTIRLDGWVLSLTEARAAALVSLS